MLASVGVLCIFLFAIFGIIGVQLWKDVTFNGCYNSAGELYKPDDGTSYLCSNLPTGTPPSPISAPPPLRVSEALIYCLLELEDAYGLPVRGTISSTPPLPSTSLGDAAGQSCSDISYRGLNLSYGYDIYDQCLNKEPNVHGGAVSFENIFSTFLIIFQVVVVVVLLLLLLLLQYYIPGNPTISALLSGYCGH